MYELHGMIAVITLNNPPVNSLSAALRQHIAAAVRQAELDPAVTGVVLIGHTKAFSAGADVTEFGTPMQLAEPDAWPVVGAHRSLPQTGGWPP